VSAIYTALTLAAIVAANDHGATSTEVGLMLSIASGAGFLGALLAPRLSNHKKPSVVVLGIFWVTAAVVPLMAVNQGPYVLGALLGAGTLLAPTVNTILVSYQVALTPDAIQGQVSNAAYFVAGALSPFAPLAAGLLVSHIGSARTLLVLGLAMALVALVATGSRTMRHIPNFKQLVPA
jgi:MFS-type transporter involved in bile tolerance (Atg22 family)